MTTHVTTPTPRFRTAGPEDADRIARLHADSWRRNYRGFYTDAYLDSDVLDELISVWRRRFAKPDRTWTLLAETEDDTDTDRPLTGFVHVQFDQEDEWGSLVDNLHVAHNRRRSGIGRTLLRRAAETVLEHATAEPMYLWVLEQNTRAQQFYRACGGAFVERTGVSATSVPDLIIGSPYKLRVAWPDPALLLSTPFDR